MTNKNHEAVEYLKGAGILPADESAENYPPIAEQLDILGFPGLAKALTQIVGKRGVNKRSRVIDKIQQELSTLAAQLERAKDPDNIARLTRQIASLTKELASRDSNNPDGNRVRPTDKISKPHNLTRPYLISKGEADEHEGHDEHEPDEPDEPDEDPGPVHQREGPESTFVIGDDIIKALSEVADKLYDLDEGDLAEQVVNFLVENLKES